MPVTKSRSTDSFDDDGYSTFEIGLTRTFRLGDINNHILMSGWAAPEENHVWNHGIDASFAIWMQTMPLRQLLLKV